MKAISDGVEFIHTLQTESNYVDYEIRTSTSTLYTGRAYPIPGSSYIHFNITNILENYCNINGIKNNINLFTETRGYIDNFVFDYFVYIKEESQISYTLTVNDSIAAMYLDSGDSFNFTVGKSLQMKQSYDITKDCWLLYNYLGSANIAMYGESVSADGNIYNDSLMLLAPFKPLYFNKKAENIGYEYAIIEANNIKTYYHILPCSNAVGCLYWVNRYGGFETLLVKGKMLYSTDNKSLNYRQSTSKVINGTLYKRTVNQSNTIIKKDITKRWTLNTSYLLDTD